MILKEVGEQRFAFIKPMNGEEASECFVVAPAFVVTFFFEMVSDL